MNFSRHFQATSHGKLMGAIALGALVGGAVVATLMSGGGKQRSLAAAAIVAPISRAEAMPVQVVDAPPEVSITPDAQHTEIPLTERERKVLARLASLPDLPVVKSPAFDVKVQNAPVAKNAAASGPAATPKASPAAPPQPAGEFVIARIQVVSVENGRVFYRSVDDQMHTAAVGERLLGVNGRVIAIDEHGAELQIDGQRMRVAANNM
jgi:hypothetical protein